jgi:hypothetical protein
MAPRTITIQGKSAQMATIRTIAERIITTKINFVRAQAAPRANEIALSFNVLHGGIVRFRAQNKLV